MWSKPVRIVIFLALTASAVTDGMPSNDKRTNQNQVQVEVPKGIQTNVKDAIGNTAIKYPNERHYIRPSKKMQTAMVDDDLLEFLVRVADNPAEWNKIQRVLNMLGREEMGMPEGSDAVASTSPTIITTSMTGTVPLTSTTNSLPPLPPPLPIQQNTAISPSQQLNTSASPPLSQQKSTSVSSAPLPQPKTSVLPAPWKQRLTTVPEPPRQPETMVPTPPQKVTAPVLQLQQLKTTPQTVTSSSWPSGDWILEVVEKIRATAKARRKGTGSDAEDTYDYDEDDGGDDEDDYSNDEIEEIEEPAVAPTDASIVPATAHSPPPQPPRLMAGHMSRYQFKRIDGRPDDGRVNGTYVAVVESDRPSRGVIYDPARQKK